MAAEDPDPSKYPATIPFPDRFEGPRIVLRAYVADDAPSLKTAVDESRERLRPWIPWAGTHQHLAETRQLIAEWQGQWLVRSNFVMGLFDKATGRLLGGSGLHPSGTAKIDWALRRFEIGYWIRTGAEGQGYVLEAVRTLADAAFADLGARRLDIRCDGANTRSWRVAERAGFRLEGTLQKDRLGMAGEPRDTRVYARTRDEPPGG